MTPSSSGPHAQNGRITPLTRPTSTKLRSTLIIPTFPSVLSELIHNSLDANAKSISISICLLRGEEKIRVEDDGHGISFVDLEKVGGRYETSKPLSGSSASAGTFGFRGEALSSVAALGLIDITTRPVGSRKTWSKVIKDSNVLFEGESTRSISAAHGTIITVKDLFHNVPVRRTSLSSSNPLTTLSACRKVVEAFVLVRPDVKWVVWDEGSASQSVGGGVKKILEVLGIAISVDAFRALYGAAGVERVQNVRVSAGERRVTGFISLSGLLHKTHQYLYVNNYPIDRGDLHYAISKRFQQSRFSAFNQDDDDFLPSQYKRKSPRRLEKYPIYVLNVNLPSEDVDVLYNPQRTQIGYKDSDSVKALVLAVVDEFLKRHGFLNEPMPTQDASPCRPVSVNSPGSLPVSPLRRHIIHQTLDPSRSGVPVSSPLRDKIGVIVTPEKGLDQTTKESVTPIRKRPIDRVLDHEPVTPENRNTGVAELHELLSDLSDNGNIAWLTELISSRSRSYHRTRDAWSTWSEDIRKEASQPVPYLEQSEREIACRHAIAVNLPNVVYPKINVNFSAAAIDRAFILGQVDRKFILCAMPSDPVQGSSKNALVVIDQHAADERVSVEKILQELCDGFMSKSMPISKLETAPDVVISKKEGDFLRTPEIGEAFRRWGMDLVVPDGDGDYVQVEAKTVPSMLAVRLGRKDGRELTRLIKLYLPVLEAHLGELQAFLGEHDVGVGGDRGSVDWQRVMRWMPKEMVELANSKACRGAIMFGDKLDKDQCQRLLHKLRDCKMPFVCAHGRPSLVPLSLLDGSAITGTRSIDWKGWTGKGQERKSIRLAGKRKAAVL